MAQFELRYGVNPHQKSARIYRHEGLPFEVLNGNPSYINMLDALNSWQLVRELKSLTGIAAAASFKHTSPAGAAIAKPLSSELAESSSPLATAYVRARGADPMSSFGDWVALSDTVDESVAMVLKREVSDGCIAPGYESSALEILKTKKAGKYTIIRIEGDYEPEEKETRQVFGAFLEQDRNNARIDDSLLKHVVTRNKQIPDKTRQDMLIAAITLKYTQSNSICIAYDGQVIGVGAGQQSRIHCTRIACTKADKWFLRLHPKVLGFDFIKGVKRSQKATAIDLYFEEQVTEPEFEAWSKLFNKVPERLTSREKQEWLAHFNNIVLGSDGFIPFRDNIDRAAKSGVRYIIQPGGSTRDKDIIQAADEYNMVMVFTGVRLFHH